jgi:hypothetical protein
MKGVRRTLIPAIAFGAVLGAGLVVLANAVELPDGVLIVLFLAVVGIPAAVGALAEDKRRHPPPARTQHR